MRVPCVMLVSGTHGDEPAAPWALLNIVESGLLHPSFSYRIWPCVNPAGYQNATRANAEGEDVNRSFTGGGSTPESKAIITAHRDRRFFASLDLHEDPQADGFYCFELSRSEQKLLSPAIVNAVAQAGFPLQTLTSDFDLGYEDGRIPDARFEPGRVILDVNSEINYFKSRGLPFTAYMMRRAARFGLTLEAAGALLWDDRIAMHRVAVQHALSELAKVPAEVPPN
ncbi:MAG: succinylglutamate desuccinylase/aspartoacylase family protein [Candidatus Eremiobacteraeota bacterium]|nr:succinylglutamate desuccinylase/aspartoacylase family protein [Candidatus Eremiobacteraeota bacterium]